MCRLAILLGILFCTPASAGASAVERPSLVRSYSIVTRIVKPSSAVGTGTLAIDTYDASTGAITGHGITDVIASGSGIRLSMTGTIGGSTITMRVVNAFGVAHDRGTIYADGTIKGTIVADANGVTERGTWTMNPLRVVVSRKGFSVAHYGHQSTHAPWGIELRNVSRTQDAADVFVDVKPFGPNGAINDGGAMTGLIPKMRIPAGKTVYVGALGDLARNGYVRVTRIRVTVIVGAMRPRRPSGILPVTYVSVDRAGRQMVASVMNPYKTAISEYDYSATVVYYDRTGRILGGSDAAAFDVFGNDTIRPGGIATLEDSISDAIPVDRLAAARVTVWPR